MRNRPLRMLVPKWRIIAALGLALALLGGCSMLRVAYSQAPELAYWWLDGYADFDDEQTPRVRNALAGWFAWHRRAQLPGIVDELARAQAEVLQDSSPERACRWWAWTRERFSEAASEAVAPAADLMARLTPAQIAHVERRYEKTNNEFRDDFLAADPRERREASVKRAVERAEFVYGRLDDAQRERVAQSVAASPFDAELWFAERRQRQRDTLQLLRRLQAERPAPEAAQAAVRTWIANFERSPRPAYRRYAERLTQYNCAFAASLHNSTTPAQREAAAAKVERWKLDLRTIASD